MLLLGKIQKHPNCNSGICHYCLTYSVTAVKDHMEITVILTVIINVIKLISNSAILSSEAFSDTSMQIRQVHLQRILIIKFNSQPMQLIKLNKH